MRVVPPRRAASIFAKPLVLRDGWERITTVRVGADTDRGSVGKRRGRDWQDVTGTEPPFEELRRWQREFLDAREIEAERAARLAASIEADYEF